MRDNFNSLWVRWCHPLLKAAINELASIQLRFTILSVIYNIHEGKIKLLASEDMGEMKSNKRKKEEYQQLEHLYMVRDKQHEAVANAQGSS